MLKTINIRVYFFCSWLFSIYLCHFFIQDISNPGIRDSIHSLLLLTTYAFIYLLPAIIAYGLLQRWPVPAKIVAIILTLLSHLYIFFDSHLYDLYAFHINGFVWNLLTTPGGIASLGADQTNISLILIYLSVLMGAHFFALCVAYYFRKLRLPLGLVLSVFLVLTLSERFIYAYSQAQLYAPVLERAEAMPIYQRLTMHSLFKKMGVEIKKSPKIKLSKAKGEINYPNKAIVLDKVDKPLNIIMLISESMRWDLLNPTTMPNLSAFATKAWNYEQHYSGGNGTRQGLFSLFYGIPGNYWDMFLRNKRGPVFFDILNDYQYQYFIYTSASFTYPEMDKTIFSQIPKDKLNEFNQGEPWKRDIKNTDSLISAITHRDRSKPYFGFIFYESTHARYSFSEDKLVRDDYLKSLDYAGLSRKDIAPKIEGMKARYENAAYGIDGQIQRLLSALKASHELDNTILIVTGDHGEEFMERGRWGHNSNFTDWQVRVPMVVWMPGSQARHVTQRTSHMDVMPTLLTRLGVKNEIKDYSMGLDLTKPVDSRNVIVASWSDMGLINDAGKLVIPFKATTQHRNLATNLNDEPIDSDKLTQKIRPLIMQVLKNAKNYSK